MTDYTPILFQPRTNDDYANDGINLLPEGPGWDAKYDQNSIMYKMMYSWLSELSAVDKAMCLMIDDSDPSLTQNPAVLAFYQNLLGLPDKCVSSDSTFAEQQQQVESRLGLVGGMNADFYISFASKFGVDLTIVEYSGAICDLCECDADSSCVSDIDDTFLDFNVTFETNGDYTLIECELSDLLPAYLYFYWLNMKG